MRYIYQPGDAPDGAYGIDNMFADLIPPTDGGGGGFGGAGGGGGYTPNPTPTPAPPPTPAPTPTPDPTTPPPSALDGWNTFWNSPTYQVPLAEGEKAINTRYAAEGALESGAAMKGISDYAAGQASGALSTYLDDLYRQEALGESASAAVAGVGQNLVSQVSANNQNAGDAAANAALYGGQAAASNWNNIGGAIGTAAGGIAGALGSSYAPNNALSGYYPSNSAQIGYGSYI